MTSILDRVYERSLTTKKEVIEGDPYEVIPIKDRKCAKSTVEIYLAHRNIERLVNFDHFMNIEVLWLNGNNLRSIEGLNSNFRLKALYVHDNRLKTLEGSLKHLLHLRTLTLYNNELSDLDGVLTQMKPLVYLQHLELYDNPLSQEQHYKRRVIFALKHLEVFDRHSNRQSNIQKFRSLRERKPASSLKGKKVRLERKNVTKFSKFMSKSRHARETL